jgi:hypothetical protein
MMRRYLIVAAVSILSFTAAFSAFLMAVPEAPTLACPAQVDLGLQDENRRVQTYITLANKGREPLRVFGFKTSCGCLSISRPTESGPATLTDEGISSGDRLTVHVSTILKADPAGYFRHTISFNTNDPKKPTVTIPITACLQHQLQAEPPQINMGLLRPGQAAERRFHVLDWRPAPGEPPFILAGSSPAVQSRVVETTRLPSSEATWADALWRHTVQIVVSAPAGANSFHERIQLTDANGEFLLAIPVVGVVQADCYFSPSVVVLPRRSHGTLVYSARCLFRCAAGPCTLRVVDRPPGIEVSISDSAPEEKAVWIKRAGNTPLYQGTRPVVFLAEVKGDSRRIEVPVSVVRLANE